MITVTVTAVFYGVLILILLLAVLLAYLFAARVAEEKKSRIAEAYLERNTKQWYRVLRGQEKVTEEMIPKNGAELLSVEEIFRSYLTNVSDTSSRQQISWFADAELAPLYRKKLRSRNWSERMNALYRIEDFGMESLLGSVRQLEQKKISPDEWFQVLLIELRFRPEGWLDRLAGNLDSLSEYESRQLFYLMPDFVLNEAIERFEELEVALKQGLIEVLGMHQDINRLPFLEGLLDSPDDEIRIRSLRAIDMLGISTPDRIVERAISSPIWQERLMAARMLHRLPEEEAAYYASGLSDDASWLVREEVRDIRTSLPVSANSL